MRNPLEAAAVREAASRSFPFLLCLLLLAILGGQSGALSGPEQNVPHAPALLAVATPCVNGLAGVYPCANVDLLAFLPGTSLGGGNANDVWGWTDPLTGREYALLGLTTGTAFVDITNPQSPRYLGSLPTQTEDSIWRDLEVYADHAFIVSEAEGHGMQVFDLRQLRSVTNPPVTFRETAHYNGFSTAHTVAINTQSGFAYANGSDTCGGGLHIVNIQSPRSPFFAGCFSEDGYTHDTQCVIYNGPDTVHRTKEICFASNTDTLTIVDVTNKGAPVMLSRTGYSESGYAHQGWLTEDQAFFLMDDEADHGRRFLPSGTNTRTHIWDVSDLDAPQRTHIYENATLAIDHNLYVRGNLVYQANYTSGLRILDLSGVSTGVLREVAFFDTYASSDVALFASAWSAYPFFPSGTILVSGIGEGLFVLRHNLAGTGMGLPNFLFDVAPPSATIRAGESSTYTVTVTPQNGFSGSVSLSCEDVGFGGAVSLPPGANCIFSPNPLQINGGPATATLTITTTAAPSPAAAVAAIGVGAVPGFAFHSEEETPLYALWLVGAGLGVLALAVIGRRKPAFYCSCGLLLALLLELSCGGGGISPPPCSFSLSATNQSFGAGGGTGSSTVATQSSCSWTAVSNASWITITSGSSGTGSGTVDYSVAANTDSCSHTGTLTIAGRTFTVTQGGDTSTCSFSLSSTTQSFGPGGGSATVAVNTPGSCCVWTAASNDNWITITSGSSGTGSGTVNYSVAANTTGAARTGTMTIAGQTFTVTQPETCSFSLSPTSASFDGFGGSSSVRVSTQLGCPWTATSNASWITISCTNNITCPRPPVPCCPGAVLYSVETNRTGATRTGTMTIAGQTFTVTQSGETPPGTYTVFIRGTSGPSLRHLTRTTLEVQ